MSAGTPSTLPSKVAASGAPATKSSQLTSGLGTQVDETEPRRELRERRPVLVRDVRRLAGPQGDHELGEAGIAVTVA